MTPYERAQKEEQEEGRKKRADELSEIYMLSIVVVIMLLDKIEKDGWRWAWTKDRAEPYRCIVMGETGSPVFCAYAENRTEAICMAIAKAYGYGEDV